MPIHVLYDITTHALARFSRRSRTGIFRYADSLFTMLDRSPDVKITPFDPINQATKLPDTRTDTTEGLSLMARLHKIQQQLPGPVRALSRSAYWTYRYHLAERYYKTLAASENFQVFHSTFHRPLWSVREDTGVAKIITIHDLLPITHPEYFKGTAAKRTHYRLVSSIQPDWIVITVSEHTRQVLLTLRPDLSPDRVIVTPLASDPNLFHVEPSPKRFTSVANKYKLLDQPYLLSVATLEPRKNLAALIRAFDRIAGQPHMRDYNLVLVGALTTGSDKVNLAWRQAKYKDRIIQTGYVEDDELAPLYSNAHAFIYPSLYEGFGLPVLEAMSCGTPVITGDHSSLPAVAGDAGILIDTRQQDELEAAISQLCDDQALRDNFSQRSLEQAKRFSWQRTAELTIEAYRLAAQDL